MHLAVSSGLAPGTYKVMVVAQGGMINQSEDFDVNVTAYKPMPTTLTLLKNFAKAFFAASTFIAFSVATLTIIGSAPKVSLPRRGYAPASSRNNRRST